MSNQYLILGGSGLVGSTLISKLRPDAVVTVADIRPPTRVSMEKLRYIQADLTKPGELEQLIQEVKPDVIVNTINLATIFSEQLGDGYRELVRWYVRLYQALAKTKQKLVYIQVGTTGSGGLGFNIPFTHGASLEDLPIIHKAASAGIGTGLLLMLSRSFGDRIRVAEVKPGLAIFNSTPVVTETDSYQLVVLDGGESGHYTYQEVALLTSFMGFATVDEVTNRIIRVMEHRRTLARIVPYDLIAALNATIISSSDGDGKQKKEVLQLLRRLTKPDAVLATGNLGPPSITRDLILAHLAMLPGGSKLSLSQRLTQDPAVKATLHYIQENNPDLADYLSSSLTKERFAEIQAGLTGAKEPWQVVVRLLH